MAIYSEDAFIGGVPASSPNISLNTNGSATFAGNVTLPGGGAATQALQKQEVESLISAIPAAGNGAIQISGGTGITASGDNATANQTGTTTRTLTLDTTYTDGRYVNLSGDTMTGTLTAPTVTVTGVINNSGIVKAWATCTSSGSSQAQGTVFPHTGINIASCVKGNNLGRYIVSFSTAMSSASYAVTSSNTAVNTTVQVLDKTTSGFTLQHSEASAGINFSPVNVDAFDVMICGL